MSSLFSAPQNPIGLRIFIESLNGLDWKSPTIKLNYLLQDLLWFRGVDRKAPSLAILRHHQVCCEFTLMQLRNKVMEDVA